MLEDCFSALDKQNQIEIITEYVSPVYRNYRHDNPLTFFRSLPPEEQKQTLERYIAELRRFIDRYASDVKEYENDIRDLKYIDPRDRRTYVKEILDRYKLPKDIIQRLHEAGRRLEIITECLEALPLLYGTVSERGLLREIAEYLQIVASDCIQQQKV